MSRRCWDINLRASYSGDVNGIHIPLFSTYRLQRGKSHCQPPAWLHRPQGRLSVRLWSKQQSESIKECHDTTLNTWLAKPTFEDKKNLTENMIISFRNKEDFQSGIQGFLLKDNSPNKGNWFVYWNFVPRSMKKWARCSISRLILVSSGWKVQYCSPKSSAHCVPTASVLLQDDLQAHCWMWRWQEF